MELLQDIAKTTVKLIIQEPFYGHFFTNIQRKSNPKIERVSISLSPTASVVLDVNEAYWATLSLPTKIGSIKHQILHLVFGHVYSVNKFGDSKLFHIAADLVVNQYLSQDQLESNAITLDDFPFLNLKPKESVDYYYKRLQESPSDFSENQSGEGDGESAEENENGLSSNNKESPLGEHESWSVFEKQSGAEAKITQERLDTYAQMSAKRLKSTDFGNLPAELQTYLQEVEARLNPVLNWKRVLRLFMQSSQKTYLKSTIKKQSRRYGTFPGIKIKQKQKILIAIDTSGSINEADLGNFFSEIYHVWKQASEIKIVLCDTQIHDQYVYKGTAPTVVGGGGGTDFNPPIEYANNYRPDVLLYFTDGHAAVPKIKSRVPIIWIISSDGLTANNWYDLPGRKVKLTDS